MHPLATRLIQIIEKKQSRLAIAADLLSQNELLSLADLLGPEICVLKTHVDILEDYTADFGVKLREIAKKHDFLIFEDRKFADIGRTVSLQYEKGLYHIAEWADLINAHVLPGPGIIEALQEIGRARGRGLLLIAEMSSQGTLAKGSYAKKTVQLGERYPDFVIGFIAQHKLSQNLLTFTPGIGLKSGKDRQGQRYRTIEQAVKRGSDVLIVGREITQATDPLAIAKKIKERIWNVPKSSSSS